jgi:SOS-response transcriptional repressor LexA
MMQGNQSKLDKNQNGKIDSQDFKMLRSKKEVGEMGKPSLKAKFEAAMQKQYKSRPENMKEDLRSELKELPSKEVKVLSKKKPLKSMSKKYSFSEKVIDVTPTLFGFGIKK